MAQFNADLIKPASKSAEFSKGGSARAAKDVLLQGIDAQLALFKNPKAEGRRWFRSGKTETAFSLRYSNRALALVDGETQAVVPTDKFEDAMAWFKGLIEKGQFDEQLAQLEVAREARTNKLRNTRAAKKAQAAPQTPAQGQKAPEGKPDAPKS